MSLSAIINEKTQSIQVTLSNTGPHTFLVTMGGHLGGWCGSAFQLFLEGNNPSNGRLLSDCGEGTDNPGVIAGRLDSWVVLMPRGSSYGLTIPLKNVRLMQRLHSSLADMMDRDWTLRARFKGSLDENYVLEWQSYHNKSDRTYIWNKKVPFWTGTVETTVSHHR